MTRSLKMALLSAVLAVAGWTAGPAASIADEVDLILPAALDVACGPRPDVERALMNAGYSPIWHGTSDADGLATVLWETSTRSWLITTTRGDAHVCISDFGWESSRR
jgi:hypothetical protein